METTIDLRAYIEFKRGFFSKHHYEEGDVAPVIPYAVLVKRDEAGRPAECHLRGYRSSLPQHLCYALLTAAERYGLVPLLEAVYTEDGFIVKGLPRSFDEALTLLEDLPFPPINGAIQALYKPHVERMERAELWLLGGATLLGEDLEKYYTVIVDIGGVDKWRQYIRVVEEHWPREPPPGAHSILKTRVALVEELAEKRQAAALVASREPRIAVLPLLA